MSTIFDSEVYEMRKRSPFCLPSPVHFMAHQCDYFEGPCTLTVAPRRSVASRRWWTLAWTQDGRQFEVSAQEWELCFWRAIQVYKNRKRASQIEDGPVSHGGGFAAPRLDGFEDGQGI